ncbi:DUF1987 domain-containing protein [uncultured Microscilla sp.]|uniref:DUF1987 domain-containing protein n=1 Tax=uncultured Microscilla sp. TaxID=432653 RepID=UPI002620B62C|nr:DUF1987 domain-containing protein [uncultured Microscilla sp.]
MDDLRVQDKEGKSYILFNRQTNLFEIYGEDSAHITTFYEQVKNWLEAYMQVSHKPISVNLQFLQYHASSYAALLQILQLFNDLYTNKKILVMINWFVNCRDMKTMKDVKTIKSKVGVLPLNILKVEKA